MKDDLCLYKSRLQFMEERGRENTRIPKQKFVKMQKGTSMKSQKLVF